ncbi:MAG: methyltransferase domain-containing protein, partial [Acidobacteriaceae bacterium]
MNHAAQQHWNERYLSGEFAHRDSADPFVVDAEEKYLRPLLPAGSAGLDLAGGQGQHALWLAQQGWRMTLADFSDVALGIAREDAADLAEGSSLEIVQGRAAEVVSRFQEERRQFEFVLVTFFLDRAVLPWLPKILAPGGLLIYRTYTVDNERLGNPRGPRDPDFLLRSQELLETFPAMKILHYNETVFAKGVAELIAQYETD